MARTETFRFIIGIDLGTTQCALSYYDREAPEKGIQPFSIPQSVSKSEVQGLATLPSILFLPDAGFPMPKLPWKTGSRAIVGRYAGELGCEVPSRYIHSAKSWLCHPRVDRTAPILPWQSEAVSEKLSPVQATAALLRHLEAVWNHLMAGDDADCAFRRQNVIITVPASFDPAARNLTLAAITQAGLADVTLLEEPQAAFYEYLFRCRDALKKELSGIKNILVVDIGGGTTDFSLIGIERPKGSPLPVFHRLAVGPHLLIGGDNIDLAIARIIEEKLRRKGRKLLTKQWLQLIADARIAKERILSSTVDEQIPFTVSGAGSKVISQSVREYVDAAEIRQIILEGFFPLVDAAARPADDTGLGLSEAGLPYTREPAVTRHLAQFLEENRLLPDAVLYNGGTTIAPGLRERVTSVLTTWRDDRAPKILENPYPTLAVARGAVFYGMTRQGLGQLIHSGSPVSLYLGIGDDPAAAPGQHLPQQLLCLLPKGSETETECEIPGKSFGVDRSRDAGFYLYFSTTATPDERPGSEGVKNWRKFKPLPPLTLPADPQRNDIEQVRLSVNLRETGYLQILCHHDQAQKPEELNFDVHHEGAGRKAVGKKGKAALTKKQSGQIAKLIEALFDPKAKHDAAPGTSPFNLVYKTLEEILGAPRKDWDLPTLRALFDQFSEEPQFFTHVSKKHDSQISAFRLLGYCLRPGFGHPEDRRRLDFLWDLSQKSFTAVDSTFWSEHWLLWKRVAAGLNPDRQTTLAAVIEPLLFPSKKPVRGLRKIEQHERNNLWRLLGHLERLPVVEKDRLGWWIIKNPSTFSTDSVALYALGRLGARMTSYADQTLLVPRSTAEAWIESLIKYSHLQNSYLDWALKELGRRSADRLMQVDDGLRKKITDQLRKHNRKKDFIAPLLEIRELTGDDFAESVGETLPNGFVWVKDHAAE
jgi:molecular chaperone DnaK (HSP70)